MKAGFASDVVLKDMKNMYMRKIIVLLSVIMLGSVAVFAALNRRADHQSNHITSIAAIKETNVKIGRAHV